MSSVPDPSQPAANNPPNGLVKGQEVSLGCGTLILIGLIVLIVGRAGTGDLEREVKGLRSEVRELKKAVEAQTNQIKAVQDKLDKAK
jgi:Sec-independent protein translocase protein TatA